MKIICINNSNKIQEHIAFWEMCFLNAPIRGICVFMAW